MAWYDPRSWFKPKPPPPPPQPPPPPPEQPQFNRFFGQQGQPPFSPGQNQTGGWGAGFRGSRGGWGTGGGDLGTTPSSMQPQAPQWQQTPDQMLGQTSSQQQVQLLQQASIVEPDLWSPNRTQRPAAPKTIKEISGRFQNDFFTLEGQIERLKNVNDVMNSIRPFGGGGITANIGDPTLRGVTEFIANKPFEAALYASGLYKAVTSALLSMDKIGSIALSQGGAKTLASTAPEAAGAVSKGAQAAGKVTANTATKAKAIEWIRDFLSTKLPAKNSVAGFLVKYGIIGTVVAVGSDIAQGPGVKEKEISYIKDSHELIQKLREAGLNDEADEIAQQNKDLEEGLDSAMQYIPGYGSIFKKNLIADAKAKLTDNNIAYDAMVREDNTFVDEASARVKQGVPVSIEELAKAYSIDPNSPAGQMYLAQQSIEANKVNIENQRRLVTKMMQMTDEDIINDPEILTAITDDVNSGSLLEQLYQAAYGRFYSQLNKAEQRAYEQQQTEEARRYQEQKTAEARAYARSQEPPPPPPPIYNPASTLNFGLLHTPGGGAASSGAVGTGAAAPGAAGTETPSSGAPASSSQGDVGTTAPQPNKDAIAMYLFGKLYVELTPEQQAVVDKW